MESNTRYDYTGVPTIGDTGVVHTSDAMFNQKYTFEFPDGVIGVLDTKMETIEKTDVLRNNLMQQQVEIEKQISVLEGQLQRQKEYLAKIEGGIDVLDELSKV